MIQELLRSTRSFRRFKQTPLTEDDILTLAEAVRLCPSAGNLQRIRIRPVTDSAECASVFANLGFAAYLKDWPGPAEGQRPAAYVVVLGTKEPDINLALDAGLCMEAMLLSMRERGIGGCIFRSFNGEAITELLGLEGYYPIAVLALGYPDEQVELTSVTDGNIRYYRDGDDRHLVPKYGREDYLV